MAGEAPQARQPWTKKPSHHVLPLAAGGGPLVIDHAGRTWGRQAVVYQVYIRSIADGGYDVADYRDIDPAFGTLAI